MARGGDVDLVIMTLVVALLIPEACIAKEDDAQQCSPSSCGSIRNISYPFRLKGDPDHCGDKELELSCENNRTSLYLHPAKYYVLDISYSNRTMRVVDAGIDDHDNCSLPSYPVNLPKETDSYIIDIDWYRGERHQMVFLNCTKPLTNSSRYVDFTPCFNQSLSTAIKTYHYASYLDFEVSDGLDYPRHSPICIPQFSIPTLPYTTTNITVSPASRIHQQLLAGFQLGWEHYDYSPSCPSSCGSIRNIRHPFRLKGDPDNCGVKELELSCENNRTTLYLHPAKYYVLDISYFNETMRVVDAGIDHDDICSLPSYPINLPEPSYSYFDESPYRINYFYESTYRINYFYEPQQIFFLNCTVPLTNSSRYVDFTPCFNQSLSTAIKTYLYASTFIWQISDVPQYCTIQLIIPILPYTTTNITVTRIHQQLLAGFQLGWGYYHNDYSEPWFKKLWVYKIIYHHGWRIFWTTGRVIMGRTSLGILCFIAFLIYKFHRRHLSFDDTIEEYLQSNNNFVPIRYSYLEIKAMTNGFKDKLGQGGFGTVYKGKQRSGHLVAVKVLAVSKANGQDFINEVATIGRIHHVNVVRLIGFCVEGSKQVLVYDFMANGSLDTFIFGRGENVSPLSWEMLYTIGVGVTRGIEYLHRGCEMQILHFDIKPHNILLDENFIPKVSDFGLAKLFPIDNSIVSLTAVRGTIGYIAPELFYKNIGGVSYKADVYSFGMLLMEMVGRRKNLNTRVEHLSQIYFPTWIYDQINGSQGEIELGDANEDEKKIARQMIIVALWCIQLKPINRPSMSQVLEMLESKVETLQMPPKPSVCPEGISMNEDEVDNNPARVSLSSNSDVSIISVNIE